MSGDQSRSFKIIRPKFPVRIDSVIDGMLFVAAIVWIGEKVMNLFAAVAAVRIGMYHSAIDGPKVLYCSPCAAIVPLESFFPACWPAMMEIVSVAVADRKLRALGSR